MRSLAKPVLLLGLSHLGIGNLVTTFDNGSKLGWSCIWMLVLSLAFSTLFHALASRLFISTKKKLPQIFRDEFPMPVGFLAWILCELSLSSSDLAMITFGSICLNMIFGLHMVTALVLMNVDILLLNFVFPYFKVQRSKLDSVFIGAFLLCGLISFLLTFGSASNIFKHSALFNSSSLSIRNGMIFNFVCVLGGSLCPHNLFLHSSLDLNFMRLKSRNNELEFSRFYTCGIIFASGVSLLFNLIIFLSVEEFLRSLEIVSLSENIMYHLGYLFIFSLLLALLYFYSATEKVFTGQIVLNGFLNVQTSPQSRLLFTRILSLSLIFFSLSYRSIQSSFNFILYSQIIFSLISPLFLTLLVKLSTSESLMKEFKISKSFEMISYGCISLILFANLWLLLGSSARRGGGGERDEMFGTLTWDSMSGDDSFHSDADYFYSLLVFFQEIVSKYDFVFCSLIAGGIISAILWLFINPLQSDMNRNRIESDKGETSFGSRVRSEEPSDSTSLLDSGKSKSEYPLAADSSEKEENDEGKLQAVSNGTQVEFISKDPNITDSSYSQETITLVPSTQVQESIKSQERTDKCELMNIPEIDGEFSTSKVEDTCPPFCDVTERNLMVTDTNRDVDNDIKDNIVLISNESNALVIERSSTNKEANLIPDDKPELKANDAGIAEANLTMSETNILNSIADSQPCADTNPIESNVNLNVLSNDENEIEFNAESSLDMMKSSVAQIHGGEEASIISKSDFFESKKPCDDNFKTKVESTGEENSSIGSIEKTVPDLKLEEETLPALEPLPPDHLNSKSIMSPEDVEAGKGLVNNEAEVEVKEVREEDIKDGKAEENNQRVDDSNKFQDSLPKKNSTTFQEASTDVSLVPSITDLQKLAYPIQENQLELLEKVSADPSNINEIIECETVKVDLDQEPEKIAFTEHPLSKVDESVNENDLTGMHSSVDEGATEEQDVEADVNVFVVEKNDSGKPTKDETGVTIDTTVDDVEEVKVITTIHKKSRDPTDEDQNSILVVDTIDTLQFNDLMKKAVIETSHSESIKESNTAKISAGENLKIESIILMDKDKDGIDLSVNVSKISKDFQPASDPESQTKMSQSLLSNSEMYESCSDSSHSILLDPPSMKLSKSLSKSAKKFRMERLGVSEIAELVNLEKSDVDNELESLDALDKLEFLKRNNSESMGELSYEPGSLTSPSGSLSHIEEPHSSKGWKISSSDSLSHRSFGGSAGAIGGVGGSGSGSLSRFSGLGRGARRQFAAILDEFWGMMFDLHGQSSVSLPFPKQQSKSSAQQKMANSTPRTDRNFVPSNDFKLSASSYQLHPPVDLGYEKQMLYSHSPFVPSLASSPPSSLQLNALNQRQFLNDPLISSFKRTNPSLIHDNEDFPIEGLNAYNQTSIYSHSNQQSSIAHSPRQIPPSNSVYTIPHSSTTSFSSFPISSGSSRYDLMMHNLQKSPGNESIGFDPSEFNASAKYWLQARDTMTDVYDPVSQQLRALYATRLATEQSQTLGHEQNPDAMLNKRTYHSPWENPHPSLQASESHRPFLPNQTFSREQLSTQTYDELLEIRRMYAKSDASDPSGQHVRSGTAFHAQDSLDRLGFRSDSSTISYNESPPSSFQKAFNLPTPLPSSNSSSLWSNAPYETLFGKNDILGTQKWLWELNSKPEVSEALNFSPVNHQSSQSISLSQASLYPKEVNIHHSARKDRSQSDSPMLTNSIFGTHSEKTMMDRLRVYFHRLMKLDGSEWLFRFDTGYDEDLMACIALREKALHDDAFDVMDNIPSDISGKSNPGSHDKSSSFGMEKNDLSVLDAVILSGEGVWGCENGKCIWNTNLIINFGVWCVHRILELSQMESRPDLWGKYTYVLNRLQGILDKAFLQPRSIPNLCDCFGEKSGLVASSLRIPRSYPVHNFPTIPEAAFYTKAKGALASIFLDMIKEIEIAVSSRKGRTGTAAGDVAFPRGKENLASVLKRYKRKLGNKNNMGGGGYVPSSSPSSSMTLSSSSYHSPPATLSGFNYGGKHPNDRNVMSKNVYSNMMMK